MGLLFGQGNVKRKLRKEIWKNLSLYEIMQKILENKKF